MQFEPTVEEAGQFSPEEKPSKLAVEKSAPIPTELAQKMIPVSGFEPQIDAVQDITEEFQPEKADVTHSRTKQHTSQAIYIAKNQGVSKSS